jgi:ABC-type antimicrobial peptide transport system permease subunit
MALVLAGFGLGLAGALALSRLLESQLFGIGASDPPTYAAVSAVLVGTGLLASYLPARRAARLDPVDALRRG